MKKILGSMLVCVVAGCGMGPEESIDEGGTASTAVSQAALCSCSTLPPMPVMPPETDYRTWIRTHPQLFPLGSKSGYAVLREDPRDPTRFIAAGYDYVLGKGLFVIHGSKRNDLADTLQNLASSVSINEMQLATDKLFFGLISGVKVGPKTPIGPFDSVGAVLHPLAAKQFQIDQEN